VELILKRNSGAQNSPGELRRSRSITCSNLVLSSLERIEKRSQAISEKTKTAGFLDKTKDCREVVDLVEELRNAIVYYQVSRYYTDQTGGINKSGVDLTATVDIQSDRTIDRKVTYPGH